MHFCSDEVAAIQAMIPLIQNCMVYIQSIFLKIKNKITQNKM
jgi:hypothetical protein